MRGTDPKEDPKKKGNGKTPKKGTEEYYQYMAKKNKVRYKKTKKKVDELGSGSLNKNPKTNKGGVGAYTAQAGGAGSCNKKSCSSSPRASQRAKTDGSGVKMAAQKTPKGRSFQTGSKELSTVLREQHKKDQKILKGEGGGSSGYKKMAREKTATKQELRDNASSIRQSYTEKMKGKPYEERMRLKNKRDAELRSAKESARKSNKKSTSNFKSKETVKRGDSSLKRKKKVKVFKPKADVIRLGK